MEKTIKEWLELLPEPYRTKALASTSPMYLLDTRPTLPSALADAFYWNYTPDGYLYWKTLHLYLQQGGEPSAYAKKDPMVHHPKHYTKGDIECIDAMASVVTGLEGMEAVHTANVIKYMWRWKDKNGLQDLEKAKWYLDKLIEKVKKEK